VLLPDGRTVERRAPQALGPSLSELLDRRARGEARAWGPTRCAAAVRDVAHTLGRLHERDLVHGDVRPEHLLLDPQTGGLLLRSAQMTPGRPLGLEPAGTPLTRPLTTGGRRRGADRYLAPELFAGERSPLVDQYALGVTAREALTGRGMPALTGPVRAVLQRATAPRPSQRHPSTPAFGDALTAAIASEAPSTLADRAMRARADTRAAWEPTALALAMGVVATFADARDGGSLDGLVAGPLMGALLIAAMCLLTFLIARFAALFGAERRRLVTSFVYRPGVAPTALAAILAVRIGAHGSLDRLVVSVLPMLWLVYAVRGAVGRPRPQTGMWVVWLLRRWERRLVLSPRRRRAVELAGLAAAIAVLLAPTLAGRHWPISPTRWRVPQLGATTTLWNFRLAVFQGNAAAACRLTRLAPHAGRADCRAIAPIATAVQRADPASGAPAAAFGGSGDANHFLVQPVPGQQGRRQFSLLGPEDREIGYMYSEQPDAERLVVLLSRVGPYDGPLPRKLWTYELAEGDGQWWIAAFRACETAAPGSGSSAQCVVTDEISSDRVQAARRQVAAAQAGAGR
jgi:hypothetical protein